MVEPNGTEKLPWTYGPSFAWTDSSANANYSDAMIRLIDFMMEDRDGSFLRWFNPQSNGELDIYFEFTRHRPPTSGITRRRKGGLSYTRRFDLNELRGLSKRQIHERAADHLSGALGSISRFLSLDLGQAPTEEQMREVASRNP